MTEKQHLINWLTENRKSINIAKINRDAELAIGHLTKILDGRFEPTDFTMNKIIRVVKRIGYQQLEKK